jgi:hypothetical protein
MIKKLKKFSLETIKIDVGCGLQALMELIHCLCFNEDLGENGAEIFRAFRWT